jgi:cleavage and polyadenylation specificity factor subunit 1
VREHRLHGIVTGLQGVKIMASAEDGLDRLVISFKDAKVRNLCFKRNHMLIHILEIALLEWSESIQDLVTVSIHTYERAPQLVRD